MKAIYVADDGTEFDDQFECEDYEESTKHCNLYDVTFLDSSGKSLKLKDRSKRLFDNLPYVYQNCNKIVVHNEEEVVSVQWLADYYGWCCEFEQITSPGTWIREDGAWKKEE